MHEELVDREMLGEPLKHLLGRLGDCLQNVVHQLRLIVVRQARNLLAHQLAGNVPSAGDPADHQRTAALSPTCRIHGLAVDAFLAELKQRLQTQPVVRALNREVERQGDRGRSLDELQRASEDIALDERFASS